MGSKQKVYGVTEDGVVITEEVADRLAAEAEAGYDLGEGTVVIRRGRPPRTVTNPELEARLNANRELLSRASAERDELIREAIGQRWPERRIASALGVAPSTVNRVAKQGTKR